MYKASQKNWRVLSHFGGFLRILFKGLHSLSKTFVRPQIVNHTTCSKVTFLKRKSCTHLKQGKDNNIGYSVICPVFQNRLLPCRVIVCKLSDLIIGLSAGAKEYVLSKAFCAWGSMGGFVQFVNFFLHISLWQQFQTSEHDIKTLAHIRS